MQLYDFGVNDSGSFYYVMKLLEGLDLHQIVNRFGPQPAERVTMLLRQACRSLAEAHEHGLVHRDIKPANLFVTRLGSEYDYLKVLDFGIVKDQPGQDATILTSEGILQGTPAFMAPELISGSRLDGRTDLYSLAATVYQLMTGRIPADALERAGAALAGQTDPLLPAHKARPEIPATLSDALARALAIRLSDRPSSASEFRAILRAAATDGASDEVTRVRSRSPKSIRSRLPE